MILDVADRVYYVDLMDGNGRTIKACSRIDTETGEAIVFIDLSEPGEWPERWIADDFLGASGTIRAKAWFALPITVTTSTGIRVDDMLQLSVTERFRLLGEKLKRRVEVNKKTIDDGFLRLLADLGMTKAGIFH